MSVKLVVVAKKKEAQELYTEALSKFDVEVKGVTSLAMLEKELIEAPYQGIFLDLPTKMIASKREKVLSNNILFSYPICLVKPDRDFKEFGIMLYDHADAPDKLDYFVNQQCKSFKPRKIRRAPRIALILNVLIHPRDKTNGGKPEYSITINVSEGGMYIYGIQERNIGDQMVVSVKELEDQTPIACIVRWRRKWGTVQAIPGYGVEFTSITESQKQQLEQLLADKSLLFE